MIDQSELDAALGRILTSVMTEATQRIANHVGENTPVESGHPQQIWQGVFNKIKGVRVDYPQASGDRLADQTGTVETQLTGIKQRIRINSNAPFIRTIEYGGIIRPIRPGGTKRTGAVYPGPYLGARFMYSTGWLCWRDASGELKFATEVNYRARRPVNMSVEQAAQEMRHA